jgi:hypothetical protein
VASDGRSEQMDECSLEIRTGGLQWRGWRQGKEESTAVGAGLVQVKCEGDKGEVPCRRPTAKVTRARIGGADRVRGQQWWRSVAQAEREGDEGDRSTC